MTAQNKTLEHRREKKQNKETSMCILKMRLSCQTKHDMTFTDQVILLISVFLVLK